MNVVEGFCQRVLVAGIEVDVIGGALRLEAHRRASGDRRRVAFRAGTGPSRRGEGVEQAKSQRAQGCEPPQLSPTSTQAARAEAGGICSPSLIRRSAMPSCKPPTDSGLHPARNERATADCIPSKTREVLHSFRLGKGDCWTAQTLPIPVSRPLASSQALLRMIQSASLMPSAV